MQGVKVSQHCFGQAKLAVNCLQYSQAMPVSHQMHSASDKLALATSLKRFKSASMWLTHLNAPMNVFEGLDVPVGKDRNGDRLSDCLNVLPARDTGHWTFLK